MNHANPFKAKNVTYSFCMSLIDKSKQFFSPRHGLHIKFLFSGHPSKLHPSWIVRRYNRMNFLFAFLPEVDVARFFKMPLMMTLAAFFWSTWSKSPNPRPHSSLSWKKVLKHWILVAFLEICSIVGANEKSGLWNFRSQRNLGEVFSALLSLSGSASR